MAVSPRFAPLVAGRVIALDTATGAVRWRVPANFPGVPALLAERPGGGVVISDGAATIGLSGNGDRVWSVPGGSLSGVANPQASLVVVRESLLYSAPRTLRGLDAATGQVNG